MSNIKMYKYGEKMNIFLRRIRDIVCYCGLSKEEYRQIKKEAYVSNFQVWKHLHVFLLAGYLILTMSMYFSDGLSNVTIIQVIMMLYLAAASILIYFVFKEDSLGAQFLIYFTMILLLLSAMLINVAQPEAGAITFIVLLVMLPMFMIDKPYFMAILLAAAVTVYLLVINRVRGIAEFRHESILTIFYGVFGILINTFYNFIRIREFTLQKRDREHILEEKKSSEETGRLNMALKKMSESALELLGDIVEERDAESGEHIHRVKGFTYILANQVMTDLPEYNLDAYAVDLIAFSSALHDVGKISISDAILLKPGKLTAEEFEVMKTHCEKGCAIIGKMQDKWSREYLEMGISICMNHHEKWDGKGYPRGLKGDEIPIEAQIVSIADIYDALTTKRVYKDAYSAQTAFNMIMNGECGAFSEKILKCFAKCHEQFEEHAKGTYELKLSERDYELVSRSNPSDSFVIGIHDNDRTLHEKLRLDEELSVLASLSERLSYVCYVNMRTNDVTRFKADEQFTKILDSFGEGLKSNERFDKILNSIIVSEDYDDFRAATERERATKILQETGHLTTDFRIRLEDGIHYCRMRMSVDANHPDAVIIGISKRDEEHKMEAEYLNLQNELEIARREMENREKLADRLAVIDCISSEYDYVCSLNADTMDVVVYRAEAWIRDMFKNLEDIVVSPETRNTTLRGIIYPDDFEQFQRGSRHETVVRNLHRNGGVYCVNYRAYKYGKLLNYQTKYAIDRNNPKRIIIGLRSMGAAIGDQIE